MAFAFALARRPLRVRTSRDLTRAPSSLVLMCVTLACISNLTLGALIPAIVLEKRVGSRELVSSLLYCQNCDFKKAESIRGRGGGES